MVRLKKIKNFIPVLFFILILIPIFANAANIVPCGGWNYDSNGNRTTKQDPCGFDDLLKLVNNIINWIILISVPVAAGVFAWAGLKYMTTSVVEQKSEAKTMITKTLIGFVAILSAWIIVTTITNALLNSDFIKEVPVEGVK